MKKLLLPVLAFLIIFVGGYLYFSNLEENNVQRTLEPNQNVAVDTGDENVSDQGRNQDQETLLQQSAVVVVQEDLEIPWEIAFLPNDHLLVTERSGSLLKIGESPAVIEISGVVHTGEGGLLGLTLHPDFEENSYIYLYLTSEQEGRIINRVERYTLNQDEASLSNRQVILDGILGASYHDGGRIEFGPDGKLYITTGDAGNEDNAQSLDNLAGKILRVNDDGSVPEDNPFDNEVWSYGHRNPQGIAWDDEGRLWATEHGRSGTRSGFDELNLIEKGQNYGWPVIQGDETQEGMITPVIHSGPTTTWAPAGLEFVDGSLYFAGLRGEALYEAVLDGTEVTEFNRHLQGDYGRLRAVKLGLDGFLYVTTSNQDGRGSINEGDDKILKINTTYLK